MRLTTDSYSSIIIGVGKVKNHYGAAKKAKGRNLIHCNMTYLVHPTHSRSGACGVHQTVVPHSTCGLLPYFLSRKSAPTPQRAMQPDYPTHYPQPFHILFTNPLHLRDSYAAMRFHAEQYHCVQFVQPSLRTC